MLEVTVNTKLDKNGVGELLKVVQNESATLHAFTPFIQSAGTLQDLNLKMNEIVLEESFRTSAQLKSTLITHYKHEAQKHIFKILGSSNLLGNPAGLMDKLSVGVYEMTRDPITGMKEGPKGLARGV